MTTKKPNDTNKIHQQLDSEINKIHQQLDGEITTLRARITAEFDMLDGRIRAKEAEYEKLLDGAVRQDEAAHAIATDLRAAMQKARVLVERRASAAVNMRAHNVSRNFSFDPRSGVAESANTPRALEVIRYPFDPLEIIAILCTDAHLEAFAQRIVQEAGAPADGHSTNDIHVQAEILADEIRGLYEERWRALQNVGDFVDIGPIHRREASGLLASAAGAPEVANPTVTLADGMPQTETFGHSTQELVGYLALQRQRDAMEGMVLDHTEDRAGNLLEDVAAGKA